MLLAVDIGNTTLHLGLYEGMRLVAHCRVPNAQVFELDSYWDRLVAGLDDKTPSAAIVCSVNPKAKIPFGHWYAQRFGSRPIVVGEGLRVPIEVEVDDRDEVGADRVLNAYAAFRLLGPGPLVVVDFGTALTLDMVSETGAYQGGAIAPGIDTAARALSARTALLPYVPVKPVESVIGRNTIEALQAGLYIGFAGMVNALCAAAREQIPGVRFVATGGDAQMMAERCPDLTRIEPYLTLDGLRMLHEAVERGHAH